MFGWKRLAQDFEALAKATNLSDEQYGRKTVEAFSRFGRTNFITGGLVTAAGAAVGMIAPKIVRKIKEKKKVKELKDADK